MSNWAGVNTGRGRASRSIAFVSTGEGCCGPNNNSLYFLRAEGGPHQVPRLDFPSEFGRQVIVESLKAGSAAGALVDRLRPQVIGGETQSANSVLATKVIVGWWSAPPAGMSGESGEI